MAPPPPSSTITTGTKSLVAERLLLAQSQQRVGPQYTDTAPLTLQGGQSKIQRIKMSEAEDIRAVVEHNDFQKLARSESGRSSSVDYLDNYEDILKNTTKEFLGETKEQLYEEEKEKEAVVENERKSIELERKEGRLPAGSSTVPADDGVARREGSAARIEDTTTATTATSTTSTSTATGTSIDGRDENPPVGEWNSLPLLVERLRAALELSLGGRRDDEPPALPEDSGIDSEEDFRIRSSMEQALGNCKEPDLKKDLKFLEDLLLSDIQTALSRLRETLERIDVAALAKHGAASDPTSKLQLLKLVSSLLSRLQVPEETTVKIPVLPSTSLSRKRRGTRHTIGVSTEELAKARKWLEESNSLPLEEPVTPITKEQSVAGHSVNVEKKPEEIRDKCTKDAINQRQLLEDKNKEIRENCVCREIQQQVDVIDTKIGGESSMYPAQYRANSYLDKENNIENNTEDNEEKSRVSKLAAALRQRAELAASNAAKYGGSNKFSAKKSKIKRANTIDIPSYLKLQAESLGHETTGCVSLRKPINVGDKSYNSINVTVPTFQPKTENDRKFLALINRNNETPVVAPVAPFKVLGNVRTMDMSALTNENWNSKFSNIKTTFDKPSSIGEERENRSLKARANKMFPGVPQAQVYSNSVQNYTPQLAKIDTSTGFRHAPSSPFRKIEKSSPGSPSKLPPSYHWPKNAPVPTNTLKEKARMMFDRENTQPSSKSFRADLEKPSFPRPPWIEHERNENRANGTVTENGKLDYRSFCKQFAPFVGKSPGIESKKLEEQRQRELAQRERLPGVVDGKISFKIPDKRILTHQYPPVERRESKEKFEPVRSGKERGYNENSFPDATLRGSSSVAVQTGINEEQDEGRSFKVGPKISKGQNLICSNASVQTSDLDKPSISDTEIGKQWRPNYEQSDSDQAPEARQRIVLDHNQNYHTVSSDSEFNSPVVTSETRPTSSEQSFAYQKQQDYPSSFVSPALSNYNQSDDVSDAAEQKSVDWPVESSTLPDDENIQNQDISPEVGVVTRYTCAIATVASSVDSPEPHSEEAPPDSRASSSPSPSQWSWSRSRPPTNETATSEDEIRRHNLLQQSLVRRLQNEITTLNDQPNYQPSSYGPHLTVTQSQPKSISPISNYSHQQHSQPVNVTPTHQQPLNILNQQKHSYKQPVNVVQPRQNFSQPANFDQPTSSQASSRFAKFLAPVPQKKPEPTRAHSPGSTVVNRVIALREAYEQPPNSPPKTIQKERSPIPNGVTPIDSSDEYLVSCANKPSRSIVLSKSESWHQLAISNSYPRAPKVNVPASTSAHSSHPKPPKPRSPSSQKLRSKQFEASSMADSVKKMEDKIRQYFDHPAEPIEHKDASKYRRSPRFAGKGMIALSRSRTMPGITDEKLRLLIPTPQQTPLLNVNTADVDKVFDDLFEEATRTDAQ